MKNLPVIFLSIVILFSCSAPSQLKTTDILAEDLSGKLSQDKLDRIAKLIRELEQNPFDSKAKNAKLVLFKWLAESPDISVTLYPIITNAKSLDEDSRGFLLTQLMFSTAGAIIENPALKKDKINATLAGLKRTLSVYEFMKKDKGISDPYLNNLLSAEKNGNLQTIVSDIVNAEKKK